MVVLGDAVDGPDGHLKLSGSKVEPHHPLGQQGQHLAELHQPLAPQGGDHHPLAGHGDHDRTNHRHVRSLGEN